MDSDEPLHERLQRGELAAFDALYARWERRLFGFLCAQLGDRAEAEDALHEVFLKLLAQRSLDFRAGTLKAWLYQVARNECANRRRSSGRGEQAMRALGEAPAAPPSSAEESLQRDQAARALGRALERLPIALAEIYHLRVAGLSYEEMAQVLAVPVGTVKSRLHEMVSHLKKEMEPWTAR